MSSEELPFEGENGKPGACAPGFFGMGGLPRRSYRGISVKPQRYARSAGSMCHGSGCEPQLS